MNRLRIGFVTGLGLILLSFFSAGVRAQQQDTQRALQNLVQMPVAVDKVVEAGGSPEQVQELAQSLNRGDVDPLTFNRVMSRTPEIASHPEGIPGIGDFVTEQIEAGVRGELLAEAIHQHLNALGIPAHGNTTQNPPPIARNFLAGELPSRPESSRADLPQAPNAGSPSRPAAGQAPKGPPGLAPGGASGSPGGGTPSGVGR